MKAGQTPGLPRFHGSNRYHSCTYKQFGNGARLENGLLVLSKIGRVAGRWSRPLDGAPKTVTISQEADGWYAIICCAELSVQPLPPTGRETGVDGGGLKVFLITADGSVGENPRLPRRGEKKLAKAPRRAASPDARRAVTVGEKPLGTSNGRIRGSNASGPTSTPPQDSER